MNIYQILFVGTGGFLGSIARYLAGKSIDTKLNAVFPYGTLAVNIIGSFLLGIIYAWATRKTGTDNMRLFLGTGFCGGFTTFSAFALENINFLNQKMAVTSILYILISLIFGFAAVFIGIVLGKNFL
jgi:CrcB protein